MRPHGSVAIQSRVGANHAVLRRCGGQPLEARELAPRRLLDVFRQVEPVDPAAQLLQLRPLRIFLAELVLDRLQLLAEEELALPLLELRLHLRLDLRAELVHLELAVEDPRDLAQARLDVDELEQLLLLAGLEAKRRGDERAQCARIVDVRSRQLELLGKVRNERDDPREETLHVARQRFELRRLVDVVGKQLEHADEVRVVVDAAREPDATEPLNEDAQRPVGDADHLVHDRGGTDLVEVVPARRLCVLVAHRHEREQSVAADDVVDQRDRPLLPDRERRHRVREDDGLLQRQQRQGRRQLVAEPLGVLLLFGADDDEFRRAHSRTSIAIRARGTLPGASGRTTLRRPRS